MFLLVPVSVSAHSPGQYRAHAPNSGILNLRSEPTTNSSVIASIPHNTVLNVTEVRGAWGRTNFNGRNGWISLDHAVRIGNLPSSPSNHQTGQYRAHAPSSGVLNFRSEPNTNSSVIARIPHNTILNVTEVRGSWGRTTFNGRSGWISLDHAVRVGNITTTFSPVWPTNGGWISQGDFNSRGQRHSTRHGRAIDIAVPVGTPVFATEAGTVTAVRNLGNSSFGMYIEIRHDNGAHSLYAHLSRQEVHVGQRVTRGQRIGLSGNSGNSTGPHLHFELSNSTRDRMADFFPGR